MLTHHRSWIYSYSNYGLVLYVTARDAFGLGGLLGIVLGLAFGAGLWMGR